MVATTNKIGQRESSADQNEGLGSNERLAIGRLKQQVAEHVRVTFYETGAASASETNELASWAEGLESDPEAIRHSDSFISWSRSAMRSAMNLYYTDLKAPLAAALSRKLISQRSHDKWISRFRSGNVSYKEKEYWVEHQLPHYIAGWEKAGAERKALLANPALKQLANDPSVKSLQNESAFLDMHYNQRVDLLAKVRAALSVERKDKGTGIYKKLHDKAQGILYAAVAEGSMSSAKVGTWLERIFKSNAKPEVIDRFLGGGSSSLQSLVKKWREVRAKYDDVCRKGAPLKNPAVGLYMISPDRFLRMHYAQRKSWVEEASQRINDALSLEKEPSAFIRIRHALDLKDWEDADSLIRGAESKHATGEKKLSPENLARLQSMKIYLTQMRSKKKKKGSGSSAESKNSPEKAAQVCAKIDAVMTGGGIPSSMRSVVEGLLPTNEANRGINQFRWIVYNNKWCRDHNYLKYEQAKNGASQKTSEQTHYRSKNNIETKRRQDHSLDDKNSGQDAFRNTDFAKRRATLLHVDLTSSGPANLTTWLQKPQHPRELYWTTFCGHDNGQPMSEAWHNELFSSLTELRGLTRQLEGMGYRYSRSGPVKRYSSEIVTAAAADSSEASLAMAA